MSRTVMYEFMGLFIQATWFAISSGEAICWFEFLINRCACLGNLHPHLHHGSFRHVFDVVLEFWVKLIEMR